MSTSNQPQPDRPLAIDLREAFADGVKVGREEAAEAITGSGSSRPRIVYDSKVQAEVTLTYDGEGLLVTFGAMEPSDTGSWCVVVRSLRIEAMKADQ